MNHHELNPRNREELRDALYTSFSAVDSVASAATEEQFSYRPRGIKWSMGENLDHLVLSSMGIASALGRPKDFFTRFGTPDQPSRPYRELATRYFINMRGAKSLPDYSPDPQQPKTREELLNSWQMICDKYDERLQQHWTEEELDQYVLRHPRFGKLTMREMLCFTIYHNYHHLEAMRRTLED